MTTPTSQYEYRGAKAAYWDLLRGDTSNWQDRPFYWAAIKASGEPVLDVGCGTGRLLLDFLAQGITIDGVDNSPEMLELCRHKAQRLGLRPALFQQPMQDLQLPRAYRTIIVPFSSFQLVTDRAAAAEAMRCFFQHLEPGGSLVMPFMLIWQRQTDRARVTTDWEIRAEATRPDDGAVVRRWARSTFDVVNQLEHTEDRYDVIRRGEVVDTEHQVLSPATRWCSQSQVVAYHQAVCGCVQIEAVASHRHSSVEGRGQRHSARHQGMPVAGGIWPCIGPFVRRPRFGEAVDHQTMLTEVLEQAESMR